MARLTAPPPRTPKPPEVDPEPPLPLDDTPCRDGKTRWYEPDGPYKPAWLELEARADAPTPAQLRYLHALGIDVMPKDKWWAAAWIDEARAARASGANLTVKESHVDMNASCR